MSSRYTEYKKRRLVGLQERITALEAEIARLHEHNTTLQTMVREREFALERTEHQLETMRRG